MQGVVVIRAESVRCVRVLANVLVGVVINVAQVESVIFGPGGAAERIRPGAVYVMCSTVNPARSAELEGRLADRGVGCLGAPISGGAARAASGELTMMTSGRAQAYALADAVLGALSSTVYRLGDRAELGTSCIRRRSGPRPRFRRASDPVMLVSALLGRRRAPAG